MYVQLRKLGYLFCSIQHYYQLQKLSLVYLLLIAPIFLNFSRSLAMHVVHYLGYIMF